MARLFIAVDLPESMRQALTAVQPRASAGVRLVDADQMHLTLHYLGVADAERTATVLDSVRETVFALSVQGVGQFRSMDGAVTLWAGFKQSNDLRRLHSNLATALSVEGFRPEARPYTPHVAVARCDAVQAASVTDDFLARHATFGLAPVSITSFGIYSSEFVAGVPVYRRERHFRLIQPE